MACLLALSLVGCYEYRGPYTTADVEEKLTGKYPDKTIHIQRKGAQTWECWFDELPDAVFQVWVGRGGGDPQYGGEPGEDSLLRRHQKLQISRKDSARRQSAAGDKDHRKERTCGDRGGHGQCGLQSCGLCGADFYDRVR